ncbi:hypothetical protein Bbelb_418730, partial [Branchiostoma belcheri]
DCSLNSLSVCGHTKSSAPNKVNLLVGVTVQFAFTSLRSALKTSQFVMAVDTGLKEVKLKLNSDDNRELTCFVAELSSVCFITTELGLSEQLHGALRSLFVWESLEFKDFKAKPNSDDNQRIELVWSRSSAGVSRRAVRATSMEELCRAPPWRLLVQPLLHSVSLNPTVLTKVTTEEDMFHVGDLVRIDADVEG